MKLTVFLGFALMADLFLILWSAVGLVQDRRLFTTAPKDIQQKVQKHPERFPGQKMIGWVLVLIFALFYVGIYAYGAYDGIRNGFDFRQFFTRFLIMSYLLKAFDIIVFDWYLLTKSHFFQHYYPETEGCKGYDSFGFNRREQLSRIILYPFLCAFLGFLCMISKHFF